MSDDLAENVKELKIILLGNSGVGKTCIINRYIHDQFNPDSETTLGSSFSTKIIKKGNIEYRLNIWDTTGQEKYHSITKLFIKGSSAVILVYSINSLTSFEGLNSWYESIKEHLQGNEYILVVIGSKSDLIQEEVVSEEDGKKFADERDAIFKFVSSKEDPDGINNLFNTILEELIKKKIVKANDTVVIKNKKQKKKEETLLGNHLFSFIKRLSNI